MPLNSFNVGGLLRNFEAKEKVIKFSVGQKAWDYSDKCEIWYWFNCVRFGKPENLVREADWIRELNSICVSGVMTVKKYNDKIYHTINVKEFFMGDELVEVAQKPEVAPHAAPRQEQPNYSTNPKTLPQYETHDEIPF